MLGSTAKEDQCRVCGGDGSTCNSVQGICEQNDFQTGTFLIATTNEIFKSTFFFQNQIIILKNRLQ